MQFQVPQHVDIEDKLAFRLTLKQLGWFALSGAILFIIWTVFEKWVFWVFFPFVVAGAAMFSFYKPAGLTLLGFLIDGVKYFIRPKEMVWEKGSNDISLEDEYGKRKLDVTESDHEREIKSKERRIREVGGLAKILDEKSDL
jgi:hypothetical protein